MSDVVRAYRLFTGIREEFFDTDTLVEDWDQVAQIAKREADLGRVVMIELEAMTRQEWDALPELQPGELGEAL